MIIIDTFQRNFVGNENSAEDVGNFINKLDIFSINLSSTDI